MRIRLLTALTCALCSCASPPRPPAAVPASTAEVIEFAGVFGGRSSQSIYDPRGLQPKLMDRVLVEPSLLAHDDPKKGIEDWTRRKLFQSLGRRGSLVIGPPLPASAHQPPVERAPSGRPPAASVSLRNVRFVSGHDDLAMHVTRGRDGHWRVGLGAHARSECPSAFEVNVPFVQLRAQVQRLSDDAIVAVLNEVAVLDPPRTTTVTAALPAPEDDRKAFCDAVAAAIRRAPGVSGGDARFDAAAQAVLETGLAPLYVKGP